MMRTHKRLQNVYTQSEVILFDKHSKFIIFSDCHRGQGNAGDNFLNNQNLFFGALEYYYENDFTYVELGDGDELWENRKIKTILEVHSDAFWLMSKFYNKNRLYMIWGNHDIAKSSQNYFNKKCNHYYCEYDQCYKSIFPALKMREGLILENNDSGDRIFLVHGHQGSLLNDRLWPLARFLVRYFWGPLELIGFIAPTGAGRPHKRREQIEKSLSIYADKLRHILIAGHTHRPVFSEPGNGYYFNDGSCVHPRCITGIEIENNKISLVKWSVCTRKDRTLYICRQILSGPSDLSEYPR